MAIHRVPIVLGALTMGVWLLGGCQPAYAQDALPHLRTQGDAAHLVVDGEPFLMLGGELGNSSASSLAYMAPIWPKLAELKLNTVLAPVYWELIEPEEGRFDFALVDGLLAEARAHEISISSRPISTSPTSPSG